MVPKANARPGRCGSCGSDVKAGEGYSYLSPEAGWSVSCSDPACRAMLGTAPPAEPLPAGAPTLRADERTKLDRDSLEVFGLASVAVSRGSHDLALEVCRKLSALGTHYALTAKIR